MRNITNQLKSRVRQAQYDFEVFLAANAMFWMLLIVTITLALGGGWKIIHSSQEYSQHRLPFAQNDQGKWPPTTTHVNPVWN